MTGYGSGWLEVNGERHTCALELGNDYCRQLTPSPASLAELDASLLEPVIAAHPAVVLFGSGAVFAMAPSALIAPLLAAGIGAESMDSTAAARTFNVIVGEARQVVAFLLPPH